MPPVIATSVGAEIRKPRTVTSPDIGAPTLGLSFITQPAAKMTIGVARPSPGENLSWPASDRRFDYPHGAETAAKEAGVLRKNSS